MTQEPDQPFIRHLDETKPFTLSASAHLREVLNPDQTALRIHFSLAATQVEPGGHTPKCVLADRVEIYHILRGTATVYLNDVAYSVRAGDTCYIPAGCTQWLQNSGPERFEYISIVDPPWTAESIQFLDQ